MNLTIRHPLFPIASAAASIAVLLVWLLSKEDLASLMGEHGAIERGTAALFILSSVGFAWIAVKSRRMVRAQAVFWSLLALLCAGEESSWLQHELGFETPAALVEANAQGEFNLHNLRGIHGGKLIEAESVSPALGLVSAQNLFRAGFISYFLLLPAAAMIAAVRSILGRLQVAYLGWRAVITIWMPIVTTVLLALVSAGETKSFLAETRELFYAVGFATLALLLAGYVQRQEPAQQDTAPPGGMQANA